MSNTDKTNQLLELLSNSIPIRIDTHDYLMLTDGSSEEIRALIEEYNKDKAA